jgi:serine/threonine-protein kinase
MREHVVTRRIAFAALATAAMSARDACAGDTVLAESLFQQGRSLMAKGDYAAACPRLSESYTQDPSTGTLLALALCQERSGKTASAWASYLEVVTRSRREGRADREQAARERVDALEPTLSRLTIEVDATTASIPELVVTRDGNVVGQGAWGAPTPIDPGEHVVAAAAPGKQKWSTSVKIGTEATTSTVNVPVLEDSSTTAPPAPSAVPSSKPDERPASTPFFTGSPMQIAGIAFAGAGVLGLGASAFFGLRASSLNSDSKSDGHCDANNQCDPYGLAKRGDAADAANLATVFLVAGAGAAAAGATLFLLGRSGESPARVDAAALAGPGLFGVKMQGRF